MSAAAAIRLTPLLGGPTSTPAGPVPTRRPADWLALCLRAGRDRAAAALRARPEAKVANARTAPPETACRLVIAFVERDVVA
jgi:hypothetical protein